MYTMNKRERERDLNAKPIFDLKQENRNKNNTNENIKKYTKRKRRRKKEEKRGKKERQHRPRYEETNVFLSFERR